MALIEILRPVNLVIVLVSVLVGGWVGRTISLSISLFGAALASALAAGFGNVINDYFDIETDKISHPKRPLPSGRLDKRGALLYASLLIILALILAFAVSPILFIITLAVSVVLFLYAYRLKNFYFSNSIVAVLCSLAFVVGGLVTSNALAVFPAAFAFFFHFAREIVKDVLDMQGDVKSKSRSLPLTIGPDNALKIAANILLILIILLPLPVVLGQFSIRYLIAAVVLLIPLLAFIIIKLLKQHSTKTLSLLNTLLKVGMVVGLSILCLV